MPRFTPALGLPCWVELDTGDLSAAIDFYTSLFGWEARRGDPPHDGYVTFHVGGDPVAGAIAKPYEPAFPDAWFPYLLVADASAAAETARTAGAEVLGPMAIEGRGDLVIVDPPGGGAVQLWQPRGHEGFGIVSEAGAPMWFELLSREYDTSLEFAHAVLGWHTVDVTAGIATRFVAAVDSAGEARAGLGDEPDHPRGSHWLTYFGSLDVDATAARAAELGGSVVVEPHSTPYGRLATIADPWGAVFALMSAPGAPA